MENYLRLKMKQRLVSMQTDDTGRPQGRREHQGSLQGLEHDVRLYFPLFRI